MENTLEVTGKTVQEAVDEALSQLKVREDEVVVEILEEPKDGLFGLFGSRKALVRVTLKSSLVAVNDPLPTKVSAAEETSVLPAQETRDFGTGNEDAVMVAKEFLQQVLAAMHIEVVLEKFTARDAVAFKIHGKNIGVLIGKHGQTLDSLQYLTNLVANKNSSERIRITVDIEDYRERREVTLTKLALRLANKVKRSGEKIVLEPMNPHERKIIHLALQDDNTIITASEGADPYRRVIIELKK